MRFLPSPFFDPAHPGRHPGHRDEGAHPRHAHPRHAHPRHAHPRHAHLRHAQPRHAGHAERDRRDPGRHHDRWPDLRAALHEHWAGRGPGDDRRGFGGFGGFDRDGHRGGRGSGAGVGRGGPGGGFGDDAGRRLARFFQSGDLKLLALGLLAERPYHGYEMIKAIEELAGGAYTPSPGTIYPTLTWLAEVGHATVDETEGGRKRYAITDAGRDALAPQRDALQRLRERIGAQRDQGAGVRGTPEVQRAVANLRTALHLRATRDGADAALARRIAEVLDQAAVALERL